MLPAISTAPPPRAAILLPELYLRCRPTAAGVGQEKLLYSFGEGLDGIGPCGRLWSRTPMEICMAPRPQAAFIELARPSSCRLTAVEVGRKGSCIPLAKLQTEASHRAYLIFDGAGNLYGTTSSGGVNFYGTAFELSPNGGGGWTGTVLCSASARARTELSPGWSDPGWRGQSLRHHVLCRGLITRGRSLS